MRSHNRNRVRREIAAATMATAVEVLIHRCKLFQFDIPGPVKDQLDRVEHTLTVYNATEKEMTRGVLGVSI